MKIRVLIILVALLCVPFTSEARKKSKRCKSRREDRKQVRKIIQGKAVYNSERNDYPSQDGSKSIHGISIILDGERNASGSNSV